MRYECENNDETKIYTVSFSREKLTRLLPLFEKYKYVKHSRSGLGGQILNRVGTSNRLKNKIIKFVNSFENDPSFHLLEDSIVLNDDGYTCNYIYSQEVYPEIFNYVKELVSNTIIDEEFSDNTGKLSEIISFMNKEQYLMRSILNYSNSLELLEFDKREDVDNELNNLDLKANLNYDFAGLNKLYLEILNCFNFKLINKIVKVEDSSIQNGLSLKKNLTF